MIHQVILGKKKIHQINQVQDIYIQQLIGKNSNEYLNDLWEYDPLTNTWEEKNPSNKPSPRYYHTAQVINDKMYVFGGQNNSSSFLNDLWVYDTEKNTWEEKTPVTKPNIRSGQSTQTINNKMYVFGGYDKKNFFDDLWVYDPENNTWEEKTPISNK